MRLLELFDSNVEIHWTRLTDSVGRAEFDIGSEEEYASYRFSMVAGVIYLRLFSGDEYDNRTLPSWDVAFAAVDELGDEQYDNTGSGNSLQVYAAVLQCMREFTSRNGVRALSFAADDIGRQRLYTRFIKKLLPNWSIKQINVTKFIALPPGYEKDIEE